MPSTNTAEIVEAVIFGILMIGMWIFSIFWNTSVKYSQKRNNDMRVLKTTTWLYGWASFFLMAAALTLVLGAGSTVRGSDGTKVEWARWVAFIIAGTAVAITVMFYYQFERFPDMVLWSILVAFSWSFGIALLLTGGTKLCALFSVLGTLMILAFGLWLFVQSRIVWKRFWDFLPAGLYVLFSILIWLFLWLGPAGAKVISRSWTIAAYTIVWFFMIMGISVAVWIFYRNTTPDYDVSSYVKAVDPEREGAPTAKGRIYTGKAPVLPTTMVNTAVVTPSGPWPPQPHYSIHSVAASQGRYTYAY